jgi:fermentation-respiration switch protein FrsA (DUF1100 family)
VIRVPWHVAWLVLVLAILAALYLYANRSLYFPSKYPEGLWGVRAQLGASDVWLKSGSGVSIHGWEIRRQGSRIVTLYLHGNAGNVTHRSLHAREIGAAGSSIVIIDYRGYGKSEGTPTEAGLYADAQAAYEYLLSLGYRPGQIIVHGESLGTAVAVNLASRRHCRALILEAAFSSAQEVAGTVLPVLSPLLIWSYDSKSRIGQVSAPVLFIHGDRDEIIPLRLGQALFAAAPKPKQFWVVPGAGHNDIVESAGLAYRQRLQSFYDSLESPNGGVPGASPR